MKRSLLFIAILFTASEGFCQLAVTNAPPYNSPAYLVQNVLLGTGVTVSNITYNGSPNAIGFFSNGLTTNPAISMDTGIIITSGDINFALGPNMSGSSGTDNGFPGDPDLSAIVSPTSTFNAAVLEFDFIPYADTVKFDFVFASEEYPEYTCCTVSDVFGFFISGPGISGPYSNNSANIALIPTTTTSVQINTVNGPCQSVSYCDAGNPCCGGYPQYYVDNSGWTNPPTNPGPNSIQYDGFTTVLTAISAVQCGQSYHIKIAISDAGDGIFDSGVFLRGGSFSTAGVITGSASSASGNIQGNDSTVYEGCGSLVVYFDRGNNTSTQDTVNFIVSGSAQNGVDFVNIPNYVIFGVGQDSVGITITPTPDGNNEGPEYIIIIVPQTGPCNNGQPDTIVITILDVLPLQITSVSDTICPLDPATISASTINGMPGYDYSWSNGLGTSATATITPGPPVSTQYTVTVTDTCGNVSTQTAWVYVTQPLAAFTYAYATANSVDFTNTSTPTVSWFWDFGDGNTSTAQSPNHTYPNDQTYTFLVTLIVTDANGCTDTITETITIYPDFYFYTPNAFSPNGDPRNPFYGGVGMGVLKYEMTIFNRWGELIFKSTDMATGWDGRYKGDLVQEDVYIAVFKVEGPNKTKLEKVTHVSVIR